MTVGEKIKNLIESENYTLVRINTSDEFIYFMKTLRPEEYELIKEKEKEYQNSLILLQEILKQM